MPNLKLREIIRQQRDGEDGTQRGAKGVDPAWRVLVRDRCGLQMKREREGERKAVQSYLQAISSRPTQYSWLSARTYFFREFALAVWTRCVACWNCYYTASGTVCLRPNDWSNALAFMYNSFVLLLWDHVYKSVLCCRPVASSACSAFILRVFCDSTAFLLMYMAWQHMSKKLTCSTDDRCVFAWIALQRQTSSTTHSPVSHYMN